MPASTTISHNTPIAGSITWTAFGLVYDGTQFAIPGGTTAGRYVWWKYNAGAASGVGSPTVHSGDELPADLTENDTVLFLNKFGVGQLLLESTVLDGSLIVKESIYARAIAADQIKAVHIDANAVTARHIDADAVTARNIAAGTITAEELAAGAITTDKLSVGSVGDSLVVNGSFEEFKDGMPVGWETIAATSGSADVVTGVSSSGVYALRLTSTVANANIRVRQTKANFIPVSSVANRRWYVSARIGATVATTSGVYIRGNWFAADKTTIVGTSDIYANGALTVSWTIREGQLGVPPATARYLALEVLHTNNNVATQMLVDELIAREVIISAQIGDGAVTATKILAGEVNATHIAANSIRADKIVLTDSTNLWPNQRFGVEETKALHLGTAAIYVGAEVPPVGNAVLLAARDHIGSAVTRFPIKVNEQYLVTATVKRTLGARALTGGVWTYLANGVNTANPWSSSTAVSTVIETFANGWERRAWAVKFVASQGAVAWGAVYLQLPQDATTTYDTNYLVSDLTVRRMNAGELIVDGGILTNHMTADSITGDRIKSNTLSADKIVGKSITAAQLAIADMTTLTPGGGFDDDADMLNWTTHTRFSRVATSPYSGPGCLQVAAGVGASLIGNKLAPSVTVDDEIYFEYWVKTTADYNGTSANGKLRIGSTQTGAQLSGSTHGVSTSWVKRSGKFKVPAGTSSLAITVVADHTVGTLWVDELYVRRMNKGELIVDGAIVTNHITLNTLNGDRIAANTLAGDKIIGKSVTAAQLAVTDFSNYFSNGRFDVGADGLTGWKVGSGTVVSDALAPSGKALQITSVSGQQPSRSQVQTVPVREGMQLRLKGLVRRQATATETIAVGAWFRNAANAMVTGGSVRVSATFADTSETAYAPIDGVVTVPAGAVSADLWVEYVSGTVGTNSWITELECYRMSAGELLVDGAIKTHHMTADTISGDVIKADTLSGTKIIADTIDAGKLTADAINGKTITGPLIQTSATDGRIVLDGTGDNDRLYATDDLGNEFFSVDKSYGVRVQGEVITTGAESFGGAPVSAKIGKVTKYDGGTYETPGLAFEGSIPLGFMELPARVVSTLGENIEIAASTRNSVGNPGAQIYMMTDGGMSIYAPKGIDVVGHIRTSLGRGIGNMPELPNAVHDLNIYVAYGDWVQIRSNIAATSTNYPIAQAGYLSVRSNEDSSHVYQHYWAFGSNNRAYWRTRYLNVWSPWREIASEQAVYNCVMSSGWTAFSATASPLQARLISPNTVTLTGMIKPGTKADGVTITTLPTAYRPAKASYSPVGIRLTTTGAMNSPALLVVNPSGTVTLHADVFGSAAFNYAHISTTYFLDG